MNIFIVIYRKSTDQVIFLQLTKEYSLESGSYSKPVIKRVDGLSAKKHECNDTIERHVPL